MKKSILFFTVILLAFPFFAFDFNFFKFGNKKEGDDSSVQIENQPTTAAFMSQIENKYGVKSFELPDPYLESWKNDDMIYFAKPGKHSKVDVHETINFTQKKKDYRIQLENIGTNVFYSYKVSFKVIDYDNQVVQRLETECDIPALFIYDCNFDGYEDLVFPFTDDDDNEIYLVYFWSNSSRSFSADRAKLYKPMFDHKHKKIVEKATEVKGGYRSDTYTIYEFRFGIKRFCVSYRFEFASNKDELYGFTVVFWDTEEAKRTGLGEYRYTLPSTDSFNAMDEDGKKATRKQYEKFMKMLDVL